MKKIAYAACAVVLSACANHAVAPKPFEPGAMLRVEFQGPKNERFPSLQVAQVHKFAVTGSRTEMEFPLTAAEACGSDRTVCKQAIVKTQVSVTAVAVPDKRVRVSGVVKSQMGRSLSLTIPPSPTYQHQMTMKVDDEVEVIGEEAREQPFEQILSLGDKLKIDALGGVVIVVTSPKTWN